MKRRKEKKGEKISLPGVGGLGMAFLQRWTSG
jgi:hypothetical protein